MMTYFLYKTNSRIQRTAGEDINTNILKSKAKVSNNSNLPKVPFIAYRRGFCCCNSGGLASGLPVVNSPSCSGFLVKAAGKMNSHRMILLKSRSIKKKTKQFCSFPVIYHVEANDNLKNVTFRSQ